MLTRRQIQAALPALAVPGAGRPRAARAAVDGRAGLRVAVQDSASKVRPGRVVDQPEPVAVLHAARNEHETVQVALQAAGADLPGLLVRATPLTDGNAGELAGGVDLFVANWVDVATPSDSRGATGPWPDGLVPLRAPIRVGKDLPSVLWVRVRVAAEARPGTYRGQLLLSQGGPQGASVARAVQLVVLVFAVRLPAAPSLPFLAGVEWDAVRRELGEDGPGRTLSAMGEQGMQPFTLHAYPARPRAGDMAKGWDWTPLDRALALAQRHGPGPVPVPFSLAAPIDPARFPPFSPAWCDAAADYLRQAAAHLDRNGALDRAFVYFAELDEPMRAERIKLIAAFHHLVAQAAPRLRVVQTIHAACLDCKGNALRELDGAVTLWVPNVSFLNGQAVGLERSWGRRRVGVFPSGFPGAFEAAVRRSGRPVWCYLNPATADGPAPHPAYPSLFIDHDAMAHRVVGWMAWGAGIAAMGHWMATYWADRTTGRPGAWQAPPRGEHGRGANGDGVLLYPPAGAGEVAGQPAAAGPLPSIRSECVREAGEDHKLLVLAEQRLGRAATRQACAGVYRALDDYDAAPAAMRSARLKLLTELSA